MISFKNNYFKIDTPNTTYLFKVNPLGILEHIYYGNKITDLDSYNFLEEQQLYGGGTLTGNDEYKFYENCASLEYPTSKRSDSRESSLKVSFLNNDCQFCLKYRSHQILRDYKINGLPNSHDKKETLEIALMDDARKLEVRLYYSIFDDVDIISRSTKVINHSEEDFVLSRVASTCFDLLEGEYDVVSLNGAWAKERYINHSPLGMNITKVSSNYGFSSAQTNPFVVLKGHNSTQNNGDVYGFNLLYSGNHMTTFERTPYHKIRILTGINDYSFSWTLKPNGEFASPEATLCYSNKGLNGITTNYHNFVKNHIIPKRFLDKDKPILINNWEGTYFNFDESKLLNIASKAHEVGIEMFVLDDGWFGKRNDDRSSLGDWYPNLEKLPNGIKGLSEKIHQLGMKFGLWFEPEMISPVSEVFSKHPDWAIRNPHYEPLLSRNQLVMDLTNKDVVDYLSNSIISLIKDANIDYIKWDCNRNIGDYYSSALSNQEEFLHRYMLGLYDLVNRITNAVPDVIFESCSAGGNRGDLGLLCYMPQFWCSDNTDAYSRMKIQEGTLLCYPQCCIGAHVSSSLSHQTLRKTTYDNKFNVACLGAFGYELDLTKLNDAEINEIKDQIKWYKENRKVLQFGDYYSIASIYDNDVRQYVIVSKDKKDAIYFIGNQVFEPYQKPTIIKPCGLDESFVYHVKTKLQHQNPLIDKGEYCEVEEYTLDGRSFMNSGIRLSYEWISGNGDRRIMEDFGTRLYEIHKK